MKQNEKQITKIVYSSWDFQQALSAITFLFDECDFNKKYDRISMRKFRCYESTLIISMSRPLQKSRGGTTLGLKNLGIKYNEEERKLVDKILNLRKKIVAHSDESEMNFKMNLIPIEDEINMPHIQFKESLHLSYKELNQIEDLLRRFMYSISKYLMEYSKVYPKSFERHKKTISQENKNDA